ncbi:circularly permuted type 2 ATP-grasp protein [Blastococcus sp. TF02A-30]|uniref:circularly permuted type 2 ATP-grasp protein n=1 Tax=Blastococcus sp. TF02A-30 TaxID=2250580 RepID=UPI000DEB9A0A|nr:circularly permuted type 2 ATP-grasp protein [Blastococcus sp. TF02A-30]RBY89661.1 circularly permuted type 2 ATP-grasp protein [Blastococcus sp. TF02A-30]
MSGELFAGYPCAPADEAVAPDGRLRKSWVPLGAALDRLGAPALAAAAAELAGRRRARGVALGTWTDGRLHRHPLHLDALPRPLPAVEWRLLAAGVEQRHRALNAFLADAYRAAGRRRGDRDREPGIVRAGVLPEWAVAHNPARDPGAVGLAWPGQPRAALAAVDLVRTDDGGWVVTGDDLRVPAGLGFALADRADLRAVVPELFAAVGPADPADAVPLLHAGLAAAAPPAAPGAPRIAVLTAGEPDAAEHEHALLAEALDAPLVHPGDLWPRTDGGLEAAIGGERLPVDVLYRRLDDAALGAYRTPVGVPLGVLLAEAVRAGRLGLANVPGNALADDAATFALVPAMIAHYLDEEPLLPSRSTWVLADPEQLAAVRDRLDRLVVEEVAGYGGRGAVDGRTCSAADLDRLRAEVSAAPHRFVAREPLTPATVPVLAEGGPQPRPATLRVFSVAVEGARAVPAPWSRVDLGGPVPAGQDTWLLA